MSQEKRQKNSKSSKGLFGFIPFRLELKNFPQYYNFPYNLLFASYANIDGVDMSGSAVYFPDFSTFQEKDSKQSMIYFNQYNRDWTVEIIYDSKKGSWKGSKYYQGDHKGGGVGTDWSMAFAHITMGGVVKGESVMFKKV